MKKNIFAIVTIGMLLLSSFTAISVIADDTITEGFEDGVMPPPGGWYTVEENYNDLIEMMYQGMNN